jgi:hypothetical protein
MTMTKKKRRRTRNLGYGANYCFAHIQFLPGYPVTPPEFSNGNEIDKRESCCYGRSLGNLLRFYHNKKVVCYPASPLLKVWLSWTARSIYILEKTHNCISFFSKEIDPGIRDNVQSSALC